VRRLAARWRVTAAGLVALGSVAGLWLRCGTIPSDLLDGVATPSTVIVDRYGHVLYEALGKDGSRLKPIDAATMPPLLASATIAAEDRRFYSHVGVDPVALVRAARHNLVEAQVVEGGSTITQQVAKLLIQRREGVTRRGMRSKAREMVLALRLEHRFTKREILALYLNLAAYGNQATGAARASDAYFGIEPSMLTPAQAAFLAALPQRPSAFNPWKNLASARNRQLAVIRRMQAAGFITAAQVREARDERLTLRPRNNPFDAPHFVEMVKSAVALRAAEKAEGLATGRIETTLDLDLQREVEGIIDHERASLKTHGAANVSVIVLDNHRGEWLAWEGSGDYGDAEHGGAINGPLVPRQPGSALKPFTYALAFEQGKTPATVLPDIPSHFPTAEPGVIYVPRNYDGRYRGPLLARTALAGSENVPAVALASDLGVDALLRLLSRAGLTTFDRTPSYYGLGLTLGNAEVRLDELVAAYSTFARGGVYLEPRYERVGSSRPQAGDRPPQRLMSERTAFWITDILADSDARAYIFGRGSSLEFPFPVAVKTGTSQAYHDNWTVGYTRDITVGVWVGNFDRTPLRDSSGVTGAGPIFHSVMLAAERRYGAAGHESSEILTRPAGLEEVTICTLSGERAQPWCPSRAREWLPADVNPEPCTWHRERSEGLVTTYPAEYRAWAARSAAALRAPADKEDGQRPGRATAAVALRAPADRAGGVGPGRVMGHSAGALTIANPADGTVYSIDPTLRREFQALPLRVVAPQPTSVTWLVDGTKIGMTSSEKPFDWPLAVGTHQIEARDADGRRAHTSVFVK
jgi:penicillin-binding protein 1C